MQLWNNLRRHRTAIPTEIDHSITAGLQGVQRRARQFEALSSPAQQFLRFMLGCTCNSYTRLQCHAGGHAKFMAAVLVMRVSLVLRIQLAIAKRRELGTVRSQSLLASICYMHLQCGRHAEH